DESIAFGDVEPFDDAGNLNEAKRRFAPGFVSLRRSQPRLAVQTVSHNYALALFASVASLAIKLDQRTGEGEVKRGRGSAKPLVLLKSRKNFAQVIVNQQIRDRI